MFALGSAVEILFCGVITEQKDCNEKPTPSASAGECQKNIKFEEKVDGRGICYFVISTDSEGFRYINNHHRTK